MIEAQAGLYSITTRLPIYPGPEDIIGADEAGSLFIKRSKPFNGYDPWSFEYEPGKIEASLLVKVNTSTLLINELPEEELRERDIWGERTLTEAFILRYLERRGVKGVPRIQRSQSGYIYLRNETTPPRGHLFAGLMMENFEGVNWESYTFPSEDTLLAAAIQVCDIMQHINQSGILQGDVKPSNLMIRPETEELMVVDFNNAARLDENGHAWLKAGTPGLVAPELVDKRIWVCVPDRGVRAVVGSDIYSMTAALALSAGVPASCFVDLNKYRFETFRDGLKTALDAEVQNGKISPELAIVIWFNMAYLPEQRCRSFAEMAQLLEHVRAKTLTAVQIQAYFEDRDYDHI